MATRPRLPYANIAPQLAKHRTYSINIGLQFAKLPSEPVREVGRSYNWLSGSDLISKEYPLDTMTVPIDRVR
jgi:hypothetical protein